MHAPSAYASDHRTRGAIPRPCGLPTWLRAAVAALSMSFAGHSALAQHEHSTSEFEVFVAAEGLAGHGQPHPREDDPWFDADVIFGLTHEQFRVFGEYFITGDEHDLERFQVGYEVVPDTVRVVGPLPPAGQRLGHRTSSRPLFADRHHPAGDRELGRRRGFDSAAHHGCPGRIAPSNRQGGRPANLRRCRRRTRPDESKQ